MTTPRPTPATRRGYILLEAVAALAVLSIGAVAVHRAMGEAIATRGQARDYTQARFLLEDLMGEILLQPVLREERRSGVFDEDLERFSWAYVVSRVDLPPEPPVEGPGGILYEAPQPVRYLARIEAVVRWRRRGETYELTAQTLLGPERLYVPEDPAQRL